MCWFDCIIATPYHIGRTSTCMRTAHDSERDKTLVAFLIEILISAVVRPALAIVVVATVYLLNRYKVICRLLRLVCDTLLLWRTHGALFDRDGMDGISMLKEKVFFSFFLSDFAVVATTFDRFCCHTALCISYETFSHISIYATPCVCRVCDCMSSILFIIIDFDNVFFSSFQCAESTKWFGRKM